MSDSRSSPSGGSSKNVKRNLPSWMTSSEDGNKSRGKKPDDGEYEENNGGKARTDVVRTLSKETKSIGKPSSSSNSGNFSKLLEGVVFALSGFVNPERSILRSQALAMGAEYQPDWNSECTLLVCAFPSTPKFRQVEADCGTIVSKEWISECHNQKKLVDIESYLMNAGKPWRRSNSSHQARQDEEITPPIKSRKRVENKSDPKLTVSVPSKLKQGEASHSAKEPFSPSKVKKWAMDDLNKTVSWLESQEEKPEPSEIRNIAAEGILTCLQDAIDSLKKNQDLQQITEQWNFIPRVVEELAKLESAGNSSSELSKNDLYKHAIACKRIYEAEIGSSGDDSSATKKKNMLKTHESESRDTAGYDSDETIEMTEDEIELAYKTIASKVVNL